MPHSFEILSVGFQGSEDCFRTSCLIRGTWIYFFYP